MGLGSASRRRRRLGLAVPVAVAIILAGAVSAGAVALHALTPKGCIADTGDAAGCGSNAQGLDGGEDVAVSPDGASVYAASPRRDTALVPDASSYLSRSSTALDT